MADSEDKAPTAPTQQDVAQASDAKAEATDTTKASDELSEDDLEAVAGGADRNQMLSFENQKGGPRLVPLNTSDQ